MEKRSRLYEVAVNYGLDEDKTLSRTYLVDAPSHSAAWKHVAQKFVAKPTIPDGRRAAEVAASGVKVEVADTE